MTIPLLPTIVQSPYCPCVWRPWNGFPATDQSYTGWYYSWWTSRFQAWPLYSWPGPCTHNIHWEWISAQTEPEDRDHFPWPNSSIWYSLVLGPSSETFQRPPTMACRHNCTVPSKQTLSTSHWQQIVPWDTKRTVNHNAQSFRRACSTCTLMISLKQRQGNSSMTFCLGTQRYTFNTFTDIEEIGYTSDLFRKWRLQPSQAKTISSVFHLHNANAYQYLVSLNGQKIRHDPNPVYLEITLDRCLTFREHLRKTAAEVGTRSNLLSMLAGFSPTFHLCTNT